MLDFGALPYLALFVRDRLRNRAPAKEMTLEEYREWRRSEQAEENPAED